MASVVILCDHPGTARTLEFLNFSAFGDPPFFCPKLILWFLGTQISLSLNL